MGKGSKTTTNTNQTQSQTQTGNQLPQWIQDASANNYGNFNAFIPTYTPALQSMPAGMTQDQYGADYLANNGVVNGGSGAIQSGINTAQGVAQYNPLQVNPASYQAQGYIASTIPTNQGYTAAQATSQGYNPSLLGPAAQYQATTGTASQLAPGSVQQVSSAASPEALAGYLSQFAPVYSQVAQAAMAPLQQAYQQSLMQNGAQAAQAGAFGDSRQGVMDANSANQYQINAANLGANLASTALNNASNLYGQQQGLNLNAAEANQGTALQGGTTNANLSQGMTLANMGYLNNAAQNNTAAQNNFSLANQNAANTASQFGANAANTASLQNASMVNQALNNSMLAQLQAEEANQGAQNTAGQFGATANNAAGQFNANNVQQAQVANQGTNLANEGLRLNSAGSLGNLGGAQQAQAINGMNALNGIGTQQQQNAQNVLNTQFANQTAMNNNPLMQYQLSQGALQNAAALLPNTGTSNGTSSSNSTQTYSPGWGTSLMQGLGNIAGLAGATMGLGGMFGGSSAPAFVEPQAPNLGVGPGGYIPAIAPNNLGENPLTSMLPTLPTYSSDERLKENIKPMNAVSPLEAVKKMKPVSYSLKADPTKRKQLGLLAQDVERAAPAAVSTGPTGMKQIHVPAMIGLLSGAVRDLDKKVSKRK